MVAIYNDGEKITYTQGDTFELEINSNNFEVGDKLIFVISENEDAEPTINSVFGLNGESFVVKLTLEERNRLKRGWYIYKITIISADGTVATTKSGDFEVKWGV